MSESAPGQIAWTDLTVRDASTVKEFYRAVVGWSVSEVAMADYCDYGMHAEADGPMVAGVCHARGGNADLPPQWLVYITVADLEASMARCREMGGEVVGEPRAAGGGRFCVVRDPAGAVCALYEEDDG